MLGNAFDKVSKKDRSFELREKEVFYYQRTCISRHTITSVLWMIFHQTFFVTIKYPFHLFITKKLPNSRTGMHSSVYLIVDIVGIKQLREKVFTRVSSMSTSSRCSLIKIGVIGYQHFCVQEKSTNILRRSFIRIWNLQRKIIQKYFIPFSYHQIRMNNICF